MHHLYSLLGRTLGGEAMQALNRRGWGWGETVQAEAERCCRVNMFRKLTDVDALHKRIWLRTAACVFCPPRYSCSSSHPLYVAFSFPGQLYVTVHHSPYSAILSLPSPLVSMGHVWEIIISETFVMLQWVKALQSFHFISNLAFERTSEH